MSHGMDSARNRVRQLFPPLHPRRERETVGVDTSAEKARQFGAVGIGKVRGLPVM